MHGIAKHQYSTTKIRKPEIEKFSLKIFPKHLLDDITLRKNYIGQIYIEVIAEIRTLIGNNLIYFKVVETIDSYGRYIANLLIGYLSVENASKSYLIS